MISAPSTSVWRHRDLRALATGQALSWLGDGFQPVALAVGVLSGGGDAGDLGVAMAALMAGRVICTLLGGVWGDRLQPVRIMASADAVRALLAAALAYVFLTDSWSVATLAVLMGLSGAASAFFHPAFSALKPRLVPDGEQQDANAGLAVLEHGTRVVGPLLGGAVVAGFGATAGFACNSLTFAWSTVCVLRVRVRPERTAPATMLTDLREGLRAVMDRPWLAGGILSATCYHLGNGVLLVLMPVIVIRDLGGPGSLGFVHAGMAVGGLLGGVLAGRLHPRRPIATGYAFLTLTALGFLALSRPESLAVLVSCLGVGFGALMVFGVFWETAIQRQIPGPQLARVSASDQLASFAVFPLGTLLADPLVDAWGTGPTVVGCVGLLLSAALAPLLIPDTWRVSGEQRSTAQREPAGMVT